MICLWVAGGLALVQLGRAMESNVPARPGSTVLSQLAGSYGPLAADWLWLEANLAWERRDAGETRWLLHRAVSTDPQTVYFWLNSARILAYDLPAWRCGAEPAAPVALQQRWRRAGADEAIAFLERGLEWHAHSAVLYLELANISLYAGDDRRRAAAYFRRAASCPDAPPYAARLAAAMQTDDR